MRDTRMSHFLLHNSLSNTHTHTLHTQSFVPTWSTDTSSDRATFYYIILSLSLSLSLSHTHTHTDTHTHTQTHRHRHTQTHTDTHTHTHIHKEFCPNMKEMYFNPFCLSKLHPLELRGQARVFSCNLISQTRCSNTFLKNGT